MDYDTEGVAFTLAFDYSHIFLLIKSMMKIETDSMFIIKAMTFTLP